VDAIETVLRAAALLRIQSRMSAPLDPPILAPAPDTWRALALGHRRAHPDGSIASRQAFGLAIDRPVIMSGHQATLWHPGILTKLLAADALAARARGQVAWLVVDQDRARTLSIRYPRQREGRLDVGTLEWPGAAMPSDAHPLIAEGLRHALQALDQHAGETTLARTVAHATMRLAAPFLRASPLLLFATDLPRAPAFASLIELMRRDPERCCEAYNAAIRAHPRAGIRPLIADAVQDRFELPLWHLPPGTPRRHVYAEDLPSIPPMELAPKALLMTALVRAHLCDLFIHGTGGGTGGDADDSHEGYDRVMEDWLARWLGKDAALAPATLATATRTLPLSTKPAPSRNDLAVAAWRAHHARHAPAMVGDASAEARRVELVRKIAASPRRPRALRAEMYHALHRLLDDYRRRQTPELAALDARAADMRERLIEAPIASDRTWAFPLHPEPTLRELAGEIDRAFPP
jgi:hypothetical protein